MENTTETVGAFQRLAALTSQIFEDQLHIRAAGIEVRGWTPDRTAGVVQMRVASDPGAAQLYMDETYGEGRVIVTRTQRPPAAREPYEVY
ncbi:MAG TPA: hypothetical protein VMV16_10150 [Solirubrobacteraceae bacterium]|nr:hypothetical protein [Solirubrobacteraceae bacterium]